jgi:hypothetical protein
MSEAKPSRLADRLGTPTHCSVLRYRLSTLSLRYPSQGAGCLEDWLLDVANARGAGFVLRYPPAAPDFRPPGLAELTNEDLVVAILQPHNLDRPQMIRAAAQLISQAAVEPSRLLGSARRERADRVLADLARSAVRVEPAHRIWSVLAHALANQRPLRAPILHWTRLAVPVPDARGCNAQAWRLVA